MSQKPLVSVIMPCYNTQAYVATAIKSILDQSLSDFELIIIDDGSTDHTPAEIQQISDARIRYRRHTINKGNYGSRNAGLRMARGAYVAVMDSDDIASPDRLQIQRDYMQGHPEVGCTGTSGQTIDAAGNIRGSIHSPSRYSAIKIFLLKNNCILHPSVMINHAFLKKYQLTYRSSFTYAADYELMVRCCRYFPVHTIDQELMKYRIHGNQISSRKRTQQWAFANKVRLKQLRYLGIQPNEQEKKLHLHLMQGAYLNERALEQATGWFNKLLEANEKAKYYHPTDLYNFFKDLLKFAWHINRQKGNNPNYS